MNLLHGQIHADNTVLGAWEAQPLPADTGRDEWEYQVDLEPDGIPQRYTGTFAVPSGTDPIVVASKVLHQVSGYL